MTTDNFHTDFLSPNRQPLNIIQKSFHDIDSATYIKDIIDAVSSIAMIINFQRQIVYANIKLLYILGINNINSIIGQRPGEIFNCINAFKNSAGCGTSKACKVCGAAKAIKKSIDESIANSQECRITTEVNDTTSNLDFLVSTKPVKIKGENFIIITYTDISNEKRRKILERIFFHDVINIAGGLKGLLDFLQETNDPDETKEMLEMAGVSASSLLDEIMAQRTLVAAENDDLVIEFLPVNSNEIIKEVSTIISKHEITKDKNISITSKSNNIKFETDSTILRRVLINLLKNAIEASANNDTVSIEDNKKDGFIEFSIHNNCVIPEDIQMQIFQRSFSTKGNNRGIGTYSIKLFTEKYLKGKVDFISNEMSGTTFNVRFPMQKQNTF